jgi:hypothetical protein
MMKKKENSLIPGAVEAANGWKRIPPAKPPLCDLCSRVAKWKHTNGGYRCYSCPKPPA